MYRMDVGYYWERRTFRLCVWQTGELCKMAEPTEIPFRGQTRVGPHRHHLANMTDRSVRNDDAAICQSTLTSC